MKILFWSILCVMTLLSLVFLVLPLFNRKDPPCFQRGVLIFILLFVPVLSFCLYAHWGSSRSVERYWALKIQPPVSVHPDRLLIELKQTLKMHPKSVRGWFLLGELYRSMGDYPRSVDALRRAHELRQKSPASRHQS